MSAKSQPRLSVQTFFPLIAAAYLLYVSVTGDDRALWLRWVYGGVALVLVTGVAATVVSRVRAVSRGRGAEARPLERGGDLPQ